jgi:hypothetical protein
MSIEQKPLFHHFSIKLLISAGVCVLIIFIAMFITKHYFGWTHNLPLKP